MVLPCVYMCAPMQQIALIAALFVDLNGGCPLKHLGRPPVAKFMSESPPLPRVVEPPEGGWPWLLKYMDVLDVVQRQSKTLYKVRCLKCKYTTKSATTLARVAAHHMRASNKGIATCKMLLSTLEGEDKDYVERLTKTYPSLIPRTQTTLSFCGSSHVVSPEVSQTGSAIDPINIECPQEGDMQLTIEWMKLSKEEKKERLDTCHRAWDMFFFTNNIPFRGFPHPIFFFAN